MYLTEFKRIIKKDQGGGQMKKIIFFSSIIIFGLLTGCGSKEKKSAQKAQNSKPAVNSNYILPEEKNKSGKVKIQTVAEYKMNVLYNSYIISSVKGENVVVDPFMMPTLDVIDLKPAAIMSTHTHYDHVDGSYTAEYEGTDTKLFSQEVTECKTKDFNIYSIASAHDTDIITPNPSNVIIVMEVDGLRIAHFGDCGQTKFTDEQLAKIGKIDIAFMQFDNPSYSSMNFTNKKGFNLLAQINPKIIIPTHYYEDDVKYLEELYGSVKNVDNKLEITKDELPAKTTPYIISNTHTYTE